MKNSTCFIIIPLVLISIHTGCSRTIPMDELDKAVSLVVSRLIEFESETGKKKNVAVLDFEDFDKEESTKSTRDIEMRLVHYLTVSKRFQVLEIEQKKLKKILKLLIEQSGPIHSENDKVTAGEFKNLHYIVTGSFKRMDENAEIQAKIVSLESTDVESSAKVAFPLGMSPGGKFAWGVAALLLLSISVHYIGQFTKGAKNGETSPEAFTPTACAACGEKIKNISQRGGKCMTPTCENFICTYCWNGERVRHCANCEKNN